VWALGAFSLELRKRRGVRRNDLQKT
jgi:hypothetical protein